MLDIPQLETEHSKQFWMKLKKKHILYIKIQKQKIYTKENYKNCAIFFM